MPDQTDQGRFERLLADKDEEIRRLRAIVDSYLSVDLDTGLLNRNGLIDAINRARLWWDRRREPFGVMAIRFPELAGRSGGESRQLAVTIARALADTGRAVDDTGRLDPHTFVIVLREFQQHGAITVVSRMRTAIRQAVGDPAVTGDLRFGFVVAVEGEAAGPADYLRMAVEAAEAATPDVPRFG
ncbi:MAG TPA: GGDEF domain-containing protein [Acidimicrobiia bacterium]|jgi:GGDEF domain-containing protein